MSATSHCRIFTLTRGALAACVLSLALGPTFVVAQETRTSSGGATARKAQTTAASATAREIAGRYAVLRGEGKDTGCMVTLSTDARARGYRAQLAPACRDQGIVIFDPIAWTLERGQIALTARKGHKALLELQPDGSWLKKDGKPLGLKRI